jgi:hypothetical protein
MGRTEMYIEFRWDSQRERDHYEDLDISGATKIKCVLEKEYMVVWTGSIWLGIGTSGGLL